jgi:hypothetical protein
MEGELAQEQYIVNETNEYAEATAPIPVTIPTAGQAARDKPSQCD